MVVTRELSFNLGGTITSMGLPVNAANVRLYDYWHQSGSLVKHFLCEQKTDKEGVFSFDVRKGIYCIEIVPGENTRFARQSIEAIKVTSNTNYDLVLNSGVILSGTLRDSESNNLSDAEILVFGIEPHVIRVSQKLDKNGSFSLGLPRGKYYLALVHSSSQASSSVSTAIQRGKQKSPVFFCPMFQVLELEKDLKHDISLPQLVSFKGKVSNNEGHPLADVKVTVTCNDKTDNVFAREVPTSICTVTQKDGSFECQLQKGLYTVRLLPQDDSQLAEKTISGIFVDHDRSRNYSLEPGYKLSGKVLHRGNPVPNASVNVIGVNNLDSVSNSDEDGNYSFALPGGTYDLVVAAQPDSLGAVASMELAPLKTRLILDKDTDFDIEMEEGVLVSGTVLDPSKHARAGVQLSLYATNNGEFDAQSAKRRPLWVGITGDDGSYEFRLASDCYWLVLNNQASTGHLIDVSENKLRSDLTIDDVCLVNFEVVSENDEPIPNCQVSFEAYESAKTASHAAAGNMEEIALPNFTADDGRCTFTLPQGVYSFNFHPPEHSSYTSRLIRQLSVSADMTRRVRLLAKELNQVGV